MQLTFSLMILWNSVAGPYLIERYSDLFTVGHPLFEARATVSILPWGIVASDTLGAATTSEVSEDVSTIAPPPNTSASGMTNETRVDIFILSLEVNSIHRAISPKQNAITIRYSTPLTNVMNSSNVFILTPIFISFNFLYCFFCA